MRISNDLRAESISRNWENVIGFVKDTHYCDVSMGAKASQITSLTIVYSTVYSGTDQRKHQSSTSLALGHKGPVTRKMIPFDDVIMQYVDRGQALVEISNASDETKLGHGYAISYILHRLLGCKCALASKSLNSLRPRDAYMRR